MPKESLQIKVVLKGEQARRFKIVKEHLGLETNSEVIRNLIKQGYEKIVSRSE